MELECPLKEGMARVHDMNFSSPLLLRFINYNQMKNAVVQVTVFKP